jgi:hypothetical protein
MSAHDYTPQQALEFLMRSLREKDSELAAQIQAVVDVGKDVEETEQSRGRRKRSRSYRRTVPYAYEEALRVAMDALRSYFIEQPLLVDSCLDNMAASVLEAPRSDRHRWQSPRERSVSVDPESKGKQKEVEIEVRTETQISQTSRETLEFQRVDLALVEEQRRNLTKLSSLLDFEEQ